jgi:hypothetical protein
VAPSDNHIWEEQFYQLAELFLQTDALLRFHVTNTKTSIPDIEKKYNNDITQTQRDNLRALARNTVKRIIDGTFLKDEGYSKEKFDIARKKFLAESYGNARHSRKLIAPIPPEGF